MFDKWFVVQWPNPPLELLLLLLGVLTTIYLWGTWNHSHFKKRNVPFINPIPFFGNTKPALSKKNREYFPQYILRTYRELKDQPYGGTFFFKQPVFMLRNPELIKAITVKDFDSFTDHNSYFSETREPLWGKSLFNLSGQRWKDMRSILTPAFTASKMKTMFVLVNDCCQQLVQYLEQCYEHPPEEGCSIQKDADVLILELKDLYTRYSTDVIATTAFGIGTDSLKQPTNEFYMMGRKAVASSSLQIYNALAYLISPKIMDSLGSSIIPKKVTEFFRTMIDETITTREREGIVRPDLIQLLMQAKKGTIKVEAVPENSDTDKSYELDNDDIAAQVFTFFLAGLDTTSTLLSFTSHQLAVHPEIQTRLQEEIDNALHEHGGKFTYESVHSMKYLDMVVSETLRMFPPAVVSDRLCVKPYTLNGDSTLEFKPGDQIFIPIYGLHHDPDYFPDPERFDPDRFSDSNRDDINLLAYLPFGAGPRNCIGNRFALMQTKLAVAQLLSRFNLKVVAKTPMPMKLIQKGFTISVEGDFWFGLELRSS